MKHYSHYLPFLAQNYNILLLSNRSYPSFEEIKPIFNSAIQRNTEKNEVDNINITLLANNIDVVILDASENSQNVRDLYEAIECYDEKIVILTLFDRSTLDSISSQLMWRSENILFDLEDSDDIKNKLFQILSVFYTVISIGRREVNLKSGASDVSALGDFLDFYEGSTLFIVDEMLELNQRLKAGELSKELLKELGLKIIDISEIFSKHTLFVRVAPVFKELGEFLYSIDFASLPMSGLKAFDYLSEIVDDLNKNMMDIFVDRIFQDVHVFEDSLQNNIQFMKNNLLSDGSDDESELDFF